MCVIIHKPAGLIIPPEKIETAMEYNSDGFGTSFEDRGKFNIRRVLKTDSDTVNLFIEEHKDVDMMLHLRYNTQGETSYENLHPFTVTDKKSDGVDLQFFHNGTMHQFGDDKYSDSREFNTKILRPLAKRFIASGVEDILSDVTFRAIVDEFRPANSVFTLYGSGGTSLRFGKGVAFKEDEGKEWWASNNSYFYSRNSNNYGNNNNRAAYTYYNQGGSWVRQDDQEDLDKEEESTKDVVPVGQATKQQVKDNMPIQMEDATSRLPSVTDLTDLCCYTQDAIDELVLHHPYEAALIISELLQELYAMTTEGD